MLSFSPMFVRHYLKNDGIVIVRMVDAEFTYSYEYQGNASKLVHTPLTDKCYLTLTQVIREFINKNKTMFLRNSK